MLGRPVATGVFRVATIIVVAIISDGGAHPQRHARGDGFSGAEAEARTWAPECPPPGDGKRKLCLVTEKNFIEMYVRAKAGDADAMGSTAFSFDENAESEEFKHSDLYFGALGRRFDPVQACAWRMVIADLPSSPHGETDAELAGKTCGRLDAADRLRAEERARKLATEIASHRSSMPPDDWVPSMRELGG